MNEILKILRMNARESTSDIAKMLDRPQAEVEKEISQLEKAGIIKGYQAIVDEDSLDNNQVTALIEVDVTPRREDGFDHIARRIASFPEVKSMYLMSGNYDLLLFVGGESLREVASFVSAKLAPLEGIISTTSHFMLKTYKNNGVLMETREEYEKLKITP
jgi:DNA-binding Lrp family transcriptional regulator